MSELKKVKEYSFSEMLEIVKPMTPEFLATYINKLNEEYNFLVDRLIRLEDKKGD